MGWVFSSGGGGSRKPIYNGELPRKEWLGQFTHLRGGLAKKGLIPVWTLWWWEKGNSFWVQNMTFYIFCLCNFATPWKSVGINYGGQSWLKLGIQLLVNIRAPRKNVWN